MTLQLRETWTPTQAEFDSFAAISGDDNPIHLDPDFASRTAFGRTVCHGMLIYAKLWGLVRCARPEARQLSQTMMFANPAYAGEEVELTVSQIAPGRLEMRAARASDGAALLAGEAEFAC